MKTLSLLGVVTLPIVGVGFLVGQLSAGDPPAPKYESPSTHKLSMHEQLNSRIQWEYKTIVTNAAYLPAEQLNKFGNDGWEMCGLGQRGQGVSYYFFKREKLLDGAPDAPASLTEAPAIPGPPVIPNATKPIGTTGSFYSTPSAPKKQAWGGTVEPGVKEERLLGTPAQ